MTLLGYKSPRSTMKVYAAPPASDGEEEDIHVHAEKREEEPEQRHSHSDNTRGNHEEEDDDGPAPTIVIEQKTNEQNLTNAPTAVVAVGSQMSISAYDPTAVLTGSSTAAPQKEASSSLHDTPATAIAVKKRESPGKSRLRAVTHALRMPVRRLSISKGTTDSATDGSPTKEPVMLGVVRRSGSITSLLQKRNTQKRINDFNNRALIQAKNPNSNPGGKDGDDLNKPPVSEIPKSVKKELTPEEAHRKFLILPDSKFWVIWNSLHLLALCYVCTVVPYLTAFFHDKRNDHDEDDEKDWSSYVNRIIDIFYMLDILVNFRSCYIDFETGELVYDTKMIAKTYLRRGWFFFDVFMTFPFDSILPSGGLGDTNLPFFLRILRLIRLAKLMRILKVQQLLDFCEDVMSISRNHLVVIQLVTTIFAVAHITACGFILAAKFHGTGVNHEERSWIYVNDLSDAPPNEIYVAALYWAFTMMTTVGFGDIVPITHAERIYTIFAMVLSAGVYAYVIASMSSIVALMNLGQSRYYEKINELNAYMESRKLPQALALRTRRFYRYYLTKKTVFDESSIFEGLPTNLREELVEHYIKTVIKHISFFQDVEKGFTAQIALRLKPAFFPPASLVIRMDDLGTEMFIVSKGSLDVFLTCTNPATGEIEERAVSMLFDGDHFGEMALLIDPITCHRMANVRSKMYCELHTLDYTSLKAAIDRFPIVRNKLTSTAHTRHALLNNLQKTKVGNLFNKSPIKGHGGHGGHGGKSVHHLHGGHGVHEGTKKFDFSMFSTNSSRHVGGGSGMPSARTPSNSKRNLFL